MNALKAQYGPQGFDVLAFPCNQFYLLEPEDNGTEIMNAIKYVRPGGGFVPNFQMFAMTQVNGKDEDPFYTFLKAGCPPVSDTFEDNLFYSPIRVNDVRWNFEMFLLDRSGKPVKRYAPEVDPRAIKSDIERLL